MIYFLWLQ